MYEFAAGKKRRVTLKSYIIGPPFIVSGVQVVMSSIVQKASQFQIFEGLTVLEVEGMLLHTRHFEVIGLRSNGIDQYVIRHLKDILVVHLRPKKTNQACFGSWCFVSS